MYVCTIHTRMYKGVTGRGHRGRERDTMPRVCMYMFTYIYTYIYIHTYTHVHETYSDTNMHKYHYAFTQPYVYLLIYTCTYIYILAGFLDEIPFISHMYAHIYTYI